VIKLPKVYQDKLEINNVSILDITDLNDEIEDMAYTLDACENAACRVGVEVFQGG